MARLSGDRSRGRLGRRRDRRVGRLPVPPDPEPRSRRATRRAVPRRASCASSTTSTASRCHLNEAMLTWQRNIHGAAQWKRDGRLLGQRRRPLRRLGVRRAQENTNVTPTEHLGVGGGRRCAARRRARRQTGDGRAPTGSNRQARPARCRRARRCAADRRSPARRARRARPGATGPTGPAGLSRRPGAQRRARTARPVDRVWRRPIS